MRLTLKVVSHCGQPTDNQQEKTLDRFPVIIGRSPSCDYVLDDPSKYISSNHLTVFEENGRLQIQDTSSNGVYLNASSDPLGRGNTADLGNGDSLAIGDYTLSISVSTPAAATDPFEDASSSPAQPRQDTFDPFRGNEHDWTPESSQTVDGDFWENEAATSAPGITPGGASASGPGSAPPKPAEAQSDWDDWPSDWPASPGSPDSAQPTNPPSEPDSELDWLPEKAAETVAAPRPIESGVVPIAPEPPSPRPNPGPNQGRSPRPNHPAATPSSTNLDAFFQAAGLNPQHFAHTDNQELLQNAGALLRQSLEGMMVLLQSRTELKNAIRTDVTMLARENNNPLKFSTGPEDALTKLLGSDSQRGYLAADVAVLEAIDDLKAHHLAMLEGMKSAVKSLLVQFDPKTLEGTLNKANPIMANIPITREARLWQLFEEKFSEIHQEAIDDFNEMFGKEFRKAYDTRLRELGRKPDF